MGHRHFWAHLDALSSHSSRLPHRPERIRGGPRARSQQIRISRHRAPGEGISSHRRPVRVPLLQGRRRAASDRRFLACGGRLAGKIPRRLPTGRFSGLYLRPPSPSDLSFEYPLPGRTSLFPSQQPRNVPPFILLDEVKH